MATIWAEKGRPALFEALSTVCDQIGRDLLAADNQVAVSKQAEYELTGQVDGIFRLEAENKKLRGQLATLQASCLTASANAVSSASTLPNQGLEASTSHSNKPINSVDASSTSVDGRTTPCRDCAKVLRRYHALSANFKTAKDALQRRKHERNSWIQQSEYLRKKIEIAEVQFGIQILDEKAIRMEVPTSTAMEADEPMINPSLSFMSDEGSASADPGLPELLLPRLLADEASAGQHANSETTQGEASDEISQPLPLLSPHLNGEAVEPEQEASSDLLEIVSERQVRKRKRTEETARSPVVPRIKSELADDSSPVMSIAPLKFHTQESIDLGDIAQKIQTPRKPQLLQQDGPKSEMIPRARNTTFTPAHVAAKQQPQSAIIPRRSSALMPLSVNAQPIRPTSAMAKKNRLRQLAEGIGSLAEDGAAYDAQPPFDRVQTSRVDSARTSTRLKALLNDRLVASDDEIVLSRPLKRSDPEATPGHAELGIPGRRQLPFDKQLHQQQQQELATRRQSGPRSAGGVKSGGGNSASPRDSTIRTDSRSLRRKQLSELRLEDFKVNPQANDGHDFAFSDVVRDRDDRACLPGCVDMHCCGKEFRALAISQRPNPPLTAVQRQEEQKLLEDYLGDFSYRLATMSKSERTEVWIQAKTQELANKYGKHRHRFSRMQSPPGFWDADFPNTQELKADREEATRRTNRAVAERYREATRPGGRWIFKDE